MLWILNRGWAQRTRRRGEASQERCREPCISLRVGRAVRAGRNDSPMRAVPQVEGHRDGPWPRTLAPAPGTSETPCIFQATSLFWVEQLQPAWLSGSQRALSILPSPSPGRLPPGGDSAALGRGSWECTPTSRCGLCQALRHFSGHVACWPGQGALNSGRLPLK